MTTVPTPLRDSPSTLVRSTRAENISVVHDDNLSRVFPPYEGIVQGPFVVVTFALLFFAKPRGKCLFFVCTFHGSS